MRKNGAATAAANAVDALNTSTVVIGPFDGNLDDLPSHDNHLPPLPGSEPERISADEYIYLTETRDRLTAAQEARERAEVEWGAAHAAATSFIHHLLRKHRLRQEAGDDLNIEDGTITRGTRDA